MGLTIWRKGRSDHSGRIFQSGICRNRWVILFRSGLAWREQLDNSNHSKCHPHTETTLGSLRSPGTPFCPLVFFLFSCIHPPPPPTISPLSHSAPYSNSTITSYGRGGKTTLPFGGCSYSTFIITFDVVGSCVIPPLIGKAVVFSN